MTDFPKPPLGPSRSLVDRAKAILLQPKAEWPVIDAEPTTIRDIYMGYVLPLAAIGPVATLIGGQLFGYGAFGLHWKPSLGSAIAQAVISYLVTLVGVYLLTLVIDALAPSFDGTKNRLAAFKVAAYSATAGWLAGIFGVFPSLAVLGLVGLYSLYLLYLGLPRLMRVPESKATGYTVVVIIVAAVIFIVVGAIGGLVVGAAARPMLTGGGVASGTVTVPGVGTIDLGKAEAAAQQASLAAQQAQGAAAQAGTSTAALSGDVLKAMLPASLPGGFARTDLSSASGGLGGIGGSNATATYNAGDARIELSVTDMAAAGALASLGGALNLQSNRETATGYEKTSTVDGQMITEKWDNSDHRGNYSMIVASRFAVAAEGNPPSMDALKGAVAAIDLGKLTSLAGR